jgi:serine/threonine-protein kinase RsbW
MSNRLEEVLTANYVSGDERKAFVLAVSEAFTNALIHGNQFDAQKTIKISLDINKYELRADIIDQGKDGLIKVKNPPRTDILADGGRGIRLIKHYATDVQFEQTGGGGLKISIVIDRKQLTNSE